MDIRAASRSAPPCATPGLDGGAAMELVYETACCHRLLRRWLNERLSGWGLSDVDFWVLWLCHRAAPDGVVQHELAAAVGVSAAQMSGLVERLRQHGLLAGCRGDPDRRRQYWRLTTAGCGLLDQIQAQIGEWTNGWEEACPAQDRQAFLAWVQRVVVLASLSPTEVADERAHRRAS